MKYRLPRLQLAFVIAAAAMGLALAKVACSEGVYTRSDFDGITPLQYATMSAAGRRPLYAKHPSLCKEIGVAPCELTAYVTSGSTVAVDETRGGWSHVQHIGKTSVSQGWVAGDALKDLAVSLPFDPGVPGGEDPKWFHQKRQMHFALTKGQGKPVCEAYLQRLNQTYFYEPPYCGRPENDQVPGFAQLQAVRLSAVEVNRLLVAQANLTEMLHLVPAPDALALAASRDTSPVYLDTSGFLPAVSPGQNLSVWRFGHSVDIDNDGVPDNLILWRNGNLPVWSRCGQQLTHFWNLQGPIAFILTADNSAIDERRTLDLFGHSESFGAGAVQGASIGVFSYRGEFYSDAFSVNPEPSGAVPAAQYPPELDRNILHVFHRKGGRLEQSCQLENSDLEGWGTE